MNTKQDTNIALSFPCSQWLTEVWWCQGRLLDCISPYQILVLSSGVWRPLLFHIRCFWRHNLTSYLRLQTNFLANFVDTICILFYAHFPYSF